MANIAASCLAVAILLCQKQSQEAQNQLQALCNKDMKCAQWVCSHRKSWDFNMATFQPDHSNLMFMALLAHLPVYLSTPQMLEGETTPPPLLHEADLIALMDKHGIGEVCMYRVVHHVLLPLFQGPATMEKLGGPGA